MDPESMSNISELERLQILMEVHLGNVPDGVKLVQSGNNQIVMKGDQEIAVICTVDTPVACVTDGVRLHDDGHHEMFSHRIQNGWGQAEAEWMLKKFGIPRAEDPQSA